jgi:ribosomal protein L37E
MEKSKSTLPLKAAMSFCQGCGEKVQTDWNNCINCGTQIATSENQDPSSFSDLELMQSGWTIQQIYSLRQSEISNTVSKHDESHHSISVNNTIQTCDNCGNKIFKGFRKCSHCGYETGLVKKQQFDWENPESTDYSRTSFNNLADEKTKVGAIVIGFLIGTLRGLLKVILKGLVMGLIPFAIIFLFDMMGIVEFDG